MSHWSVFKIGGKSGEQITIRPVNEPDQILTTAQKKRKSVCQGGDVRRLISRRPDLTRLNTWGVLHSHPHWQTFGVLILWGSAETLPLTCAGGCVDFDISPSVRTNLLPGPNSLVVRAFGPDGLIADSREPVRIRHVALRRKMSNWFALYFVSTWEISFN